MFSIDPPVNRFLLALLASLILAACGKEGGAPDRTAQAVAEPGVLRIATQPGEARLYIDGVPQGNRPANEGETLALRVAEGRYLIEALKPVDEFTELFASVEGVEVAERPLDPIMLQLRPRLTPAGVEREALERERLAQREQVLIARYHLDGATVTDPDGALMWMRCSLGQDWDGAGCVGSPRQFTWGQAQAAAEVFTLGGWSDWRLPTLDELYGLVYCSSGRRLALDSEGAGGGCVGDYISPTILLAVFPNTPTAKYWSSEPHAMYSYRAWGVAFTSGIRGAGGRGDYDHVRLVRDLR